MSYKNLMQRDPRTPPGKTYVGDPTWAPRFWSGWLSNAFQ
jgi:hypothetical protein